MEVSISNLFGIWYCNPTNLKWVLDYPDFVLDSRRLLSPILPFVAVLVFFASNNWFSTSSVRWAANASNVKRAFSNPSFWHSARICFIQISSTQTFIKSLSIHVFSWVFTMNPAGMLRSLIVLSVFPLKVIIGGSSFPSPVADKTTVRYFFHHPKCEPCILWYL